MTGIEIIAGGAKKPEFKEGSDIETASEIGGFTISPISKRYTFLYLPRGGKGFKWFGFKGLKDQKLNLAQFGY